MRLVHALAGYGSFALVGIVALGALASGLAACGGDDPIGDPGASSGGVTPDGSTGDASSGGAVDGGDGGPKDGGEGDASNDAETSTPGTPELQLVGRWDRTDPLKPKASWPGSRLVASWSGPNATVTLSSAGGGDGNETWVNVIVDDVAQAPVKVDGANQVIAVASGLAAGPHTFVVEKRTEAKWGTITVEGVTFDGGQLLAPPARPTRRIEFIAESTIDGFGVEGDIGSTCLDGNGDFIAPAQYDNARKSMAFHASTALSAEHHLIAASAKGLVADEDGTGIYLPALYPRTLTDLPSSAWNFASWTPDVVVLSVGGTDFAGGAVAPGGFLTAYDALVTTVRANHPNAHIFMTIWSQIKGATRAGLSTILTAVKGTHPLDAKLHIMTFTEATYPTDETGCYFHANDAHHMETAPELVTAIKAATGWN